MPGMIPVDRTHPPARIEYDDGARRLTLRPWDYPDVDALVAQWHELRRRGGS